MSSILLFHRKKYHFLKGYLFHRLSEMILKLQRGPISILKVIKGQHSVNNIGGIKVCSLCIFSVEALYLYNVLWKYFPQH